MTGGVMFDFSGTLFRIESTEQWLRGALSSAGLTWGDSDVAACTDHPDGAGALPGGPPPRHLPGRLARLWRDRDLTAAHADAYGRLQDSVRPLPGARDLLATLTEQGVRWAIATSGQDVSARPALELLGLPADTPMVTRDQVRAIMAGEPGPFLPPPHYAIAHTLLTAWVEA